MRYGKTLLLSMILHVTLLSVLVRLEPPQEKRGQGQSKDPGSAQEGDSKPIKVKIVTGQDGNIMPVYHGPHGEPCPKWFGGIGLTHEGDGTIDEIFDGYPASKIPLQHGDYIMEIEKLIGPVDTFVTFTYIRSGVFNTVTVKRARICLGG